MRAIIDSDYLDIRQRFIEAKVEPLGGFLWLDQNRCKKHPEQTMTIFYDGKAIFTITNNDKLTKKVIKAVMSVH